MPRFDLAAEGYANENVVGQASVAIKTTTVPVEYRLYISQSYTLVESSSFASSSLSASYALNGGSTGTGISTGSSYPITSSWALSASYYPSQTYQANTISSSYASSSISASYAPFIHPYQASGSWASSSISASYAPQATVTSVATSSFSYTASLLLGSVMSSSYSLSSSYAPSSPSVSASYALSASWAPGSNNVSSSYSVTASYALNSQVGPQGIPGVTGSIGPSGSQGPIGLTGPSGSQGIQGIPGETGSIGPIGPQGIPGETGSLGPIGPQGLIGPQGETGSIGPSGSQGPIGLTGLTGPQGETGSIGPSGSQGIQGIPGIPGVTGSIGPSGSMGPSGSSWNITTGSFYPITSSWTLSASWAPPVPSESSSYSLSASYAPGGTAAFTGKTNNAIPVWISNDLSATSSISADGLTVSINRLTPSSSPEVLFVRGTSSVSQNNIAEFTHDTNTYAQIKIENTNTGNTASADLVVETDKASEAFGYIDLGINSSGYSQSAFNLTTPLDGYLYTVGSASVGGNLVLGTLSNNKSIIFHTSGSTNVNERLRISDRFISASVPMSASILGSATFANTASSMARNNAVQNITASWASSVARNNTVQNITSSWAVIAPVSYNCLRASQSLFTISSSFASSSLSSSFASSVVTASFALSASYAFTQSYFTNITNRYEVSNSYASSSTSASWSPMGNVYSNIYVDAAAMYPGSASTATAATYQPTYGDGIYDVFDFDSVVSESVQFKFVMPQTWDRSTVNAKIYWTTTSPSASSVVWGLSAGGIADSSSLGRVVLGVVTSGSDISQGSGYLNIGPTLTGLVVTASAESKMVLWRVNRVPIDIRDTLAADARLLGVWIQYSTTGSYPLIFS